MATLLEVWRAAPPAEQEAFHEVTVHESRDPNALRIVESLYRRIQMIWIQKALDVTLHFRRDQLHDAQETTAP